MLDLVIKRYELVPPCAEPHEISLDVGALWHGHVYSAIVMDLQRHCLISLLLDRDTRTVVAWLAQHLGIRVVTRDRAQVYADAIRQGAPAAIQVAVGWHLLKNLGETLGRLLGRYQQSLWETAQQLEDCSAPQLVACTTLNKPARGNALSQPNRARHLDSKRIRG
jgi:transposase